jgi:acetyl-CoA carboxylase carboxyltransferase component
MSTTSHRNTRLAQLLDPASHCPLGPGELPRHGSVHAASGAIGGTPVLIGASDASVARGAIGVDEAAALGTLFDLARQRRSALVLVLDSAGARLDQGIAVLPAFRQLFAIALDSKHAGTRFAAIIGDACFGGVSMLACLAQRRLYTTNSRFGMSGPRIVAALAGKGEFNADDVGAVERLFGGKARALHNPRDRVTGGGHDELRDALIDWLGESVRDTTADFDMAHRLLRERLERAGLAIPRNPRPAPAAITARLAAFFPEGFETVIGDGVVRGVRMSAGHEVTITGIVEGARLDAVAAWMIAESIVTSVRTRPERPIIVLYDSSGHATTTADEALMLSAYLSHLAKSILWARDRGVAVSTWIIGEASSGAYVALTAAAQRVLALPGANVRVLPDTAIAEVITPTEHLPPAFAEWSAIGLVDDVLDANTLPDAVARAAGIPIA